MGKILPFGFSQRIKIVGFLALATYHLMNAAKAFAFYFIIRWLKPNGKVFLFYVFADSIVSAIALLKNFRLKITDSLEEVYGLLLS